MCGSLATVPAPGGTEVPKAADLPEGADGSSRYLEEAVEVTHLRGRELLPAGRRPMGCSRSNFAHICAVSLWLSAMKRHWRRKERTGIDPQQPKSSFHARNTRESCQTMSQIGLAEAARCRGMECSPWVNGCDHRLTSSAVRRPDSLWLGGRILAPQLQAMRELRLVRRRPTANSSRSPECSPAAPPRVHPYASSGPLNRRAV